MQLTGSSERWNMVSEVKVWASCPIKSIKLERMWKFDMKNRWSWGPWNLQELVKEEKAYLGCLSGSVSVCSPPLWKLSPAQSPPPLLAHQMLRWAPSHLFGNKWTRASIPAGALATCRTPGGLAPSTVHMNHIFPLVCFSSAFSNSQFSPMLFTVQLPKARTDIQKELKNSKQYIKVKFVFFLQEHTVTITKPE